MTDGVNTRPDAPFKVSSAAFKPGQTIPTEYTEDGKDESPALAWSGVPEKAASIAVVCVDPDAPVGNWYHWFLFNLPSGTRSLPQNLPKTAVLPGGWKQGTNDFHKVGYNGPAPPPGAMHHYHFKVMALDAALDLKPGVSKDEFLPALKGHILAQAEIIGTYRR